MSKWISVDDRLPERGVDVLVLHETGDMNVRYIPLYRDGQTHGDNGKSWYPGGMNVGWTTHWMALPELPKDGK